MTVLDDLISDQIKAAGDSLRATAQVAYELQRQSRDVMEQYVALRENFLKKMVEAVEKHAKKSGFGYYDAADHPIAIAARDELSDWCRAKVTQRPGLPTVFKIVGMEGT